MQTLVQHSHASNGIAPSLPILLVALVSIGGCERPTLRGSNANYKSSEIRFALDYVDPQKHFNITCQFPAKIDQRMASGQSDYSRVSVTDSQWSVQETVGFVKSSGMKPVVIRFDYDAEFGTLKFGGNDFDAAPNSTVVITYNKQQPPTLEIKSAS